MGMLRAVLLAECSLVLVLLLPALPPAMAAVFREIVTDPDHPGTCLFRHKGIRVKSGHVWDLPNCMLASCDDDGEDMVISYYTCGSIGVPPNCNAFRDLSKPYPDCCEVSCKKLEQPSLPRLERSARHA
ncbi:venom toxin OcyC11-like [Scylla paramamosain]|uniref:venom toxin OcyC11-like n=1 Tax=Scylla paramamosain TaxID=85552 RepID=UPI0030832A6D